MLERYGHGGDWTTARELYGNGEGNGNGPRQFIDFSANMNPFGPPVCVGELLRNYGETIVRYPDPAVRGLLAKLSSHHGAETDGLLVGNGAAELIDLLFRQLKPKATVLAEPCFSEYREAADKVGSAVRTILLRRETGFRLTMGAVREQAARLREDGFAPGETLWFLGSPNNPTGQTVDRDIVEELVRIGEKVVLDEAFMDFAEPAESARLSFLREAPKREGLAVIRSMTKFYAIPGIRLGYLAAHPSLVRSLAALQVPWSVNSLAQAIGEGVLDDAAYAERTIAWLQAERAWLIERMQRLGLVHYGQASVNYLLLEVPEAFGWRSPQLQEALGRQGILIRDASRFNGLDSSYIRVAVRQRADNERLIDHLKRLLRRGSEPSLA